jgi:hypothetical protein
MGRKADTFTVDKIRCNYRVVNQRLPDSIRGRDVEYLDRRFNGISESFHANAVIISLRLVYVVNFSFS